MYLLQENFNKCLSVSLRQFVLLVSVWWNPQAVREIQISQYHWSRIFAGLTLNFGPRLRSVLGGLKSLLLSRCAPTYISMLHIGSLSDESRTSVSHSDPRPRGASPPLPSSVHTPPTLQPTSPSPLEERGAAFGVFSDVSHVAQQSIRKSVTRGQLWISEHGETQHLEWVCQTVTRNCSGRLFDELFINQPDCTKQGSISYGENFSWLSNRLSWHSKLPNNHWWIKGCTYVCVPLTFFKLVKWHKKKA